MQACQPLVGVDNSSEMSKLVKKNCITEYFNRPNILANRVIMLPMEFGKN